MSDHCFFDLAEIRKAISVLFANVRFGDGECIEVRTYNKETKTTAVGWFDDMNLMAKWVAKAARDGVGGGYRFVHDSMYWTINPVCDGLLARKAKNRLDVCSTATSDGDVTRRLWFPIDIDPKRPSGVSATKEERALALAVANDLMQKIEALGFSDDMYIGATSGNGYHILIRIDLPNDDNSVELLKKALKGLQKLVGTERVDIDSKVFNAARIFKAYGTMARKGIHDTKRPWRMAKLLHAPGQIQVAKRELLQSLCDQAPLIGTRHAVSKKKQGSWTEENLAAYLEQTDWGFNRRDGRKESEVCQFIGRCVNDANHQDAAVILHTDGWWSYTCFHDSCSDFRHKEFSQHWAATKGELISGRDSSLDWTNLNVKVVETEHQGELIPLYNRTDAGNAERLAWRYREQFLFCPERGWFAWDDKRWVPDATSTLTLACVETARRIMDELPRSTPEDEEDVAKFTKAFTAFARDSEGRARLSAMASIAEAYLPVELKQFDSDLMKFNVSNGTVDLGTGTLVPHSRTDYITNISPVSFDTEADCPLWLKFLADVTSGNQELIDYLQRAIGYSLTGLTSEHCMFILHGIGQNGKSTFLEVFRYLMGSYGKAAGMNTFMPQHHEGIPNDLAALSTARFVSATESEDGKRLAEAKIKQITGGDTVTARFLHKEFFEFRPQFKLWLATNYKPTIYGTDEGIWRRIRLIPFTVSIPDSKRDHTLTQKLISESSGVLNWALQGLADYRRDGMQEPQIVKATTDEYRASQDWLSRFLEETTESSTENSVGARELYDMYCRWCKDTGEFQLKEVKFSEGMKQHGHESRKQRCDGKVSRRYSGMRIRSQQTGFCPESMFTGDVFDAY